MVEPSQWPHPEGRQPPPEAPKRFLPIFALSATALVLTFLLTSSGRNNNETLHVRASTLPTRAADPADTIQATELVWRQLGNGFPHGYDHGSRGIGGMCDTDCCLRLLYVEDDVSSEHNWTPSDLTPRRRAQEPPPSGCGASPEASSGSGGGITGSLPLAVTYLLIILLVMFSGLFSGLTLGLMSLDKTGLEIVMHGGDPSNAAAAEAIYPVRKNGNQLLCTLLLGNVAVNALLSILTADIWGGLTGFLVSTAVIVILGEIIPQAACSRYALQVGKLTIPLVKVIMVLFYPLAAPLAYVLDKVLGHELGTTYSKDEMSKLLEIHVKEGRFNQETGTAMAGALKYQDVLVKEVMTPLENVFMLSADEKLSFEIIAKIFKTGYSRIPVYEVDMNNIIGLLFTKDLIFIDPEDETPIRSFVQIFGRGLHIVWPDDALGDVLRVLKGGHSHMALVNDVNNEDETRDPFYEIRGIITLEDIIEVILGDEIVDETDVFVDEQHSARVDRVADFDWARLRLLDAKIVDETLSTEEVKAVSAHLRTNHPSAVELLSDRQLTRMVAETAVTELPAAEQELGVDLPADLLYEKGTSADSCTLILGGKVTVLSGQDNFRSDVSSWSVLAATALADATYQPDFSAYVSSGPCRCLKFSRERFMTAADVSVAEKLSKGSGAVGVGDTGQDHFSSLLSVDRFQAKGLGGTGAAADQMLKIWASPKPEVAVSMKEKKAASSGPNAIPEAQITAADPPVAVPLDVSVGTERSQHRVMFSHPKSEHSEAALSGHGFGVVETKSGDIGMKRVKKRRHSIDHHSRLLTVFLNRRKGKAKFEDAVGAGKGGKEEAENVLAVTTLDSSAARNGPVISSPK